jgi:PPK2 family polyphosphate:nucleotide phosphotransferase
MAILQNLSTRAPEGLDKKQIKEETAALLLELSELQNRLYAGGEHALLVILQGMDASGKDGAITNVFGKLNPQGYAVKSFKAPTPEELSHDFLWRVHPHAPARGMIQVFNRSHYEDVLITRVHGWCSDELAARRFEAINAFEKLLQVHNRTHIFKFYLHISQEEQQQRLQERITNPAKQWKHNARDFEEAKLWDRYRAVYEDAFAHCQEPAWIPVPADQNWYKEFLITSTLVGHLRGLNLQYPAFKQ